VRTETRINLGSGGRDIGNGFRSFDSDVDIFRPLPWGDASVEFIVCSHCAEHGSPAQAWSFFKECFRILRKGGAVRITVPDAIKAYKNASQNYIDWLKQMGWGDGTRASVMDNLLCKHGHLGVFTVEVLSGMLQAAGFTTKQCGLFHSDYPELAGSNHHHHQIGMEFDAIESICVEGYKS
jgi:predicted SAM-dependent methyltransferase